MTNEMKNDLQLLAFLITGTAIIIACACNTMTDTIIAGLFAPFFLLLFWKRNRTIEQSNNRTISPEDIFDWKTVPEVDENELKMWLGATDKVERQFPLAVALQAHDELEQKLLLPGKMDGMVLAEIRGGIKSLARFAQIYSKSLGAADEDKVEVNVPEDEK